MLETLSTIWNVALMLLGFGLIIVIHELGHFLAAKWAGIRVHAFAVGFGQAIFSWRKGMGFTMGSSEAEYTRQLRKLSDDAEGQDPGGLDPQELPNVSPTEYRLNWFPFGGYVKMLGQEDLNPDAATSSPDSYTQKPVWKRMIVISGGVVMNIILAAVLFMVAFSVGLKEISPAIGIVAQGSPAERAGIVPGDTVLSIDGKPARTFNDIFLATAMAAPEQVISFTVARAGEPEPITIEVTPEKGTDLGLLQVGIGPATASALADASATPSVREKQVNELARLGLSGVEPGMSLVGLAGAGVVEPGAPGASEHYSWSQALDGAMRHSNGAPIQATFADTGGSERTVTIEPRPEVQIALRSTPDGRQAFEHVLGLTPVMQVRSVVEGATHGLIAGDVFARIGRLEWPNVAQGRAEIQRHKRRSVSVRVLRDGEHVDLDLDVNKDGQVGFFIESAVSAQPFAGALPGDAVIDESSRQRRSPAQLLTPGIVPGSRVLNVNGSPVETFGDIATALRSAAALGASAIDLDVEFYAGDDVARETVALALTEHDSADLAALGWNVNDVLALFQVQQFVDKASGPIDAMVLGVKKTHYVVVLTYITFARLVQGTVPVSQLNGPVGITHIGSRVAERGFIYLLFFLGLISANLAVVNFLPLPVVDGGHFIFLLIEGITRRPVSIAVQNLATIAGLVLIGMVFVVVTFNDIMRLVG